MVLRITGIVLLLAIGFIAFAKWDEYQRACEMRDNQDFRRQFSQETDVSSEISFIDPTPTPMPRFSIIGLFDDQKLDPKTRDSRGYSAQDYSTDSEECSAEGKEDLAIALTGRSIHMLEALSRARHPELYKAQAPKDSPHKATPISPEEARDHVGQSVSVRGLVEQVRLSKEGAFLNFGGYPNQIFKGFVPAQSVDHVGGEQFLKSLAGNPITVTGKMALYIGHPEIVISSPEQIARE